MMMRYHELDDPCDCPICVAHAEQGWYGMRDCTPADRVWIGLVGLMFVGLAVLWLVR